MASKDLHEDPFDDTTIAKLEIFEDYAQAWIPTFVMQGTATICIFDFFAGTGYDKNGVPGSPIRILNKIREQIGHIFQKKVKLKVFFNAFEPTKKEQKKFQLLQTACAEYLEKHKDVKRAIEIKYFNENFETLFPKLITEIEEFPSLVYLDQNGIKFLSNKYLLKLEKTRQTDFLYFVLSSYLWRFGDSKEFKENLDIDMATAKKSPYKFVHRTLIEQLRKKLPINTKLKLYPYSLKKGANIHGIIFGASHPRAVDKFLAIGWRRNETNGQANFDIYDDAKKSQPDLFGEKKLTKLEEFKENLRTKVLGGEIKNNYDALHFVHDEGHISNHAAQCLKEMKKKGEITYEGISPLVTYDNVYKKHKQVEYKITKNEAK
jgi:three-Cys-motif partner protein